MHNLKKVNDNHGHEDGDRFIQNAARILREAVGENGETYRVGGDEFLAIIYGEDPEGLYQSVIKDLNDKLVEFNEKEKSDHPLSFAYGHAICASGQNYSIHDSERIAAPPFSKSHRYAAIFSEIDIIEARIVDYVVFLLNGIIGNALTEPIVLPAHNIVIVEIKTKTCTHKPVLLNDQKSSPPKSL